VAKQKNYHHGDLKRTLVEMSLEELEQVGLESLSLRALAQKAGVSKNAPYRHFADKEALLREVAAEGFAMLARQLENKVRFDGGPSAMMRSVIHAYVDFACRRSQLYRLMFSPLGYSLHSERCRINAQRAMSFLIRGVTESQAAGWMPQKNSEHLALSVWALGHGWADLLTDELIPEELETRPEDWISSAMSLLGLSDT
jgi:AcrR family transcriptional regulator